jgi:ribonuclease VapC
VIVLDTSAIIAILMREPDHEPLRAIVGANTSECALSALNYFETAMVICAQVARSAIARLKNFSRSGEGGLSDLEEFLAITGTTLVPFDAAKAKGAFRAFQRYGKGIHSKARLNLCDCAAYALAKSLNAPLLFKGDDFSATDVAPATLGYPGF